MDSSRQEAYGDQQSAFSFQPKHGILPTRVKTSSSHARRNHSLLAPEHARRRKSGGGSLPIASRSRHLHSLLRSRARLGRYPLSSRAGFLSSTFSEGLPIPSSLDAHGARKFRPARLRSGSYERVRACQRSGDPIYGAARLLLPHTHALPLGFVSRLPQRMDAFALQTRPHDAFRQLSPALGLRIGSARR